MNITSLKTRLTTGWTGIRALYLLLDLFIAIQSVFDHQWPIAIVGIYFTSMGLFSLGCAGGACQIPYKEKEPNT